MPDPKDPIEVPQENIAPAEVVVQEAESAPGQSNIEKIDAIMEQLNSGHDDEVRAAREQLTAYMTAEDANRDIDELNSEWKAAKEKAAVDVRQEMQVEESGTGVEPTPADAGIDRVLSHLETTIGGKHMIAHPLVPSLQTYSPSVLADVRRAVYEQDPEKKKEAWETINAKENEASTPDAKGVSGEPVVIPGFIEDVAKVSEGERLNDAMHRISQYAGEEVDFDNAENLKRRYDTFTKNAALDAMREEAARIRSDNEEIQRTLDALPTGSPEGRMGQVRDQNLEKLKQVDADIQRDQEIDEAFKTVLQSLETPAAPAVEAEPEEEPIEAIPVDEVAVEPEEVTPGETVDMVDDDEDEPEPGPMTEAERKELMIGEDRRAYVDAMDSLGSWFRGKEDGSEYKSGKGNIGQKAYDALNAITKSTRERSPYLGAVKLVDEAVKNMVDFPAKTKEEVVAALMSYRHTEGYPDVEPTSIAGERIFAAIEAKLEYNRGLMNLSDRKMVEIRRAMTPDQLAIKNAEHFNSIVADEYAAQQEYRTEKLQRDSKHPRIKAMLGGLGTGLKWVGKQVSRVPAPVRLGIGIIGGAAIAIGLTSGIGVAGAASIVTFRGIRGISTYLGARGASKAYGKWASRKALSNEQITGNLAEALGADETMGMGEEPETSLEYFEALESAMQSYAYAKSIEAKVARRKNIAALLTGVGIAYGSGFVQHALEQQIAPGVSTGMNQTPGGKTSAVDPKTASTPKPTDPAPAGTTSKTVETNPATAPKVNAPENPATKPAAVEAPKQATVESVRADAGVVAGKGGSVWSTVKDQMKAYAQDPTAKPTEQISQADLDVLRTSPGSGEATRILDRITARTITANHMQTMGIKSSTEVVHWNPETGEIKFGSGSNATYEMGGSKPVNVDNLPRQRTTIIDTQKPSTNVVEQPMGVKPQQVDTSAVEQTTTPVAVQDAVTEIQVAPGEEWMAGLDGYQVEVAKGLVSSLQEKLGITFDTGVGKFGNISLKGFYEGVNPNAPISDAATIKIRVMDASNNPVDKVYQVPKGYQVVRKWIDQDATMKPSTEDMNTMTVGEYVKHRVGLNGKAEVNIVDKPATPTTPVTKPTVETPTTNASPNQVTQPVSQPAFVRTQINPPSVRVPGVVPGTPPVPPKP